MSCEERRDGLLDLARGASPAHGADERDRLEAHLAGCASCHQWLEEQRALSAALGSLADHDEGGSAPDWLEGRLREAVRRARPEAAALRGPRPDRWRWALGAAAAASLAAASLLWRREPTPLAPEPAEWVREAVEGEDEEAFVAVTDEEALSGLDAVQVVRMRLPREAVGRLGLALSGDFEQGPVEADVLVGQDGVPRAIRLVSASSQPARGFGGTWERGGRR